jgi:hypothetical protein
MEEIVKEKIKSDATNKKQRLAEISEQEKIENLKKLIQNFEGNSTNQ